MVQLDWQDDLREANDDCFCEISVSMPMGLKTRRDDICFVEMERFCTGGSVASAAGRREDAAESTGSCWQERVCCGGYLHLVFGGLVMTLVLESMMLSVWRWKEKMEARVSFIKQSLAASARQQPVNFTFPAAAGSPYCPLINQHRSQ